MENYLHCRVVLARGSGHEQEGERDAELCELEHQGQVDPAMDKVQTSLPGCREALDDSEEEEGDQATDMPFPRIQLHQEPTKSAKPPAGHLQKAC